MALELGKVTDLNIQILITHIKECNEHFIKQDAEMGELKRLSHRLVVCQIIVAAFGMAVLGASLMDAATVIKTLGELGIPESYLYKLATSLSVAGAGLFTLCIRYLWVKGMFNIKEIKALALILLKKT